MEYTHIITQDHPVAYHCIILDANDKPIPYVKEYNLVTKEAVVYKTKNGPGKIGQIIIDDNHNVVTEKVVLEGSRLVFQNTSTIKFP